MLVPWVILAILGAVCSLAVSQLLERRYGINRHLTAFGLFAVWLATTYRWMA